MTRDLIVGLDLGSYAFRIVAARPDPSGPDGIEILGAASVPARGVRRGTIVSLDEATRAINLLRAEVERRIGQPIQSVAVGIGGPAAHSFLSRGLVVVSRPDNRIGADDITRVLEAAGAVSLSSNDEVLDVFPREFFVDGEGGIKDVAGMQGRRLETEAVVLTVPSPHMKNLKLVLHASEIDPLHFALNAVATARATISARPKELGVAVLDIGHGTTDIAVFEEGELLSATVIPVGGGHITNDIAIGLRCSIDAAERAKHEHGHAVPDEVLKSEKVNIGELDPTQEGTDFPRRELAEIIEARLEEIFDLVQKELRRLERARLLPAGIVLTGGTANIPGIVDVARRSFKLPVQLGYPMIVNGPADVVSAFEYTTAVGLVQLAAERSGKRRRGRFKLPNISTGSIGERIKSLFKAILP